MQFNSNSYAGTTEDILAVTEAETLNLEDLFHDLGTKCSYDYGVVLQMLNNGVPSILAACGPDQMVETMREVLLDLVDMTGEGYTDAAMCQYTKNRVDPSSPNTHITEDRGIKRSTRSIREQVRSLDFYDLLQIYIMLLADPCGETVARLRADGVDVVDRALAGVGSDIEPTLRIENTSPHMMKFYLFTNRLAYYAGVIRRCQQLDAPVVAYDVLVSIIQKMASLLPGYHQLQSVARCLTHDAANYIPLALPVIQGETEVLEPAVCVDAQGCMGWIKTKISDLFNQMFTGWLPGLIGRLALDQLYAWLRDKLSALLDPGQLLGDLIARHTSWKTAAAIGAVVASCFVVLIGAILNFLPSRGINNFISVVTRIPPLEAQRADKLGACAQTGSFILTAITSAVFVYSGIDLSSIKWSANVFSAVVASSDNLAKLFVNLLHALPCSLLCSVRKLLGGPDTHALQDFGVEPISEWPTLESLSWEIDVNTINEDLDALGTLELDTQWTDDSHKSDWPTTVLAFLKMASNWDRRYRDDYSSKLPQCQSGVIAEFSNEAEEADSYIALPSGRAGGGVGGGDIPIEVGMDSFLYKKSVLWTKSMSAGDVVASYSLPQDLLSGSIGDLQTTKFKSFGLYRANMKVRVRINGNGFQAGAIVVYWLPLVGSNYTIGYNDVLATQHMMLTPKDTREAVLEIPYVHPYPYIPTDFSIGELVIRVFSQLNYVNGSDVDVMISLAFDNYEFAVPRPLAQSAEAGATIKPAEDAIVSPSTPSGATGATHPLSIARIAASNPEAWKAAQEADAKAAANKAVTQETPKDSRPKRQWRRGKGKSNSQGKRFSKGKNAQDRAKQKREKRPANVSNAQNWYNMLTKKHGGIPKVAEGQAAMLTRKGYVVVDTQSGRVVSAPENFNKTLISDLVADLQSVAPNTVRALRTMFPTAADILEWLDFLDNPPKVSTGTPVHPSYPPMANVVGERETKVLDLHPGVLYRPGRFYMDPTQMDINFLLGREFVVGSFNWTTEQIATQQVYTMKLNSFLAEPNPKGGVWNGCVALSTLNQFQFWHARFMLHFRVFKTRFHTGSLRVVLSYGSETPIANNRYTGYNKVLSFGVEEEEQDFVVEWVAPTDYLRTWDGPRGVATTFMGERDFSLGSCAVEVANQLNVANPQVPNSVSVVITCTLDDVRVAVPKVMPTVVPLLSGVSTGSVTFAQSATAEDVIVPEPDLDVEEAFADVDRVGEVEPAVGEGHSELDVGAQFEFLVGNVLDIGRRYVEITPDVSSVDKTWPVPTGKPTQGTTSFWTLRSNSEGTYLYEVPVSPSSNPFMPFYRGFSGGMSFRLYVPSGGKITKVVFCPCYGGQVSLGPLLMVGGDTTAYYWNSSTSSSISASVDLSNSERGSSRLPCMIPAEVAAPSGDSNWIDVTVPYQQHVSFMTAETSGASSVDGICIGTLSFIGPEGVKVYAKFSDDASVGVFVPPNSYKYVFASTLSTGVNATGILGYFN